MKHFRQDRSQAQQQHDSIFVGDVFTQNLISDENAPNLRVTAVTFEDGARNRWHTHSTEQALVVTHGHGIVATDREEIEVEPGDVILIDPNERHWHGARPGASMTHLAILLPGEMRTIDD